MESNDTLIIGSVVKLKDLDGPVMIIGYRMINDKKECFDYAGCIYPVGIQNELKQIYFNKKAIEKVIYEGYCNEEANEFKEKYQEFMEELDKTHYIEKLQEQYQKENSASTNEVVR